MYVCEHMHAKMHMHIYTCECGDPRLTPGIIFNTFSTLLTEAASLNKTQFSPRWSALLAVLFCGTLSTFYLPRLGL